MRRPRVARSVQPGAVVMRTARLRRRPDGVIEIRRPRVRDVVLAPDVGVVLILFFGCLLFLTALVAALVEFPYTLWFAGVCLALGLWGAREARSARLAEARVEPPSSPGAA
jgi:hypothetical protein